MSINEQRLNEVLNFDRDKIASPEKFGWIGSCSSCTWGSLEVSQVGDFPVPIVTQVICLTSSPIYSYLKSWFLSGFWQVGDFGPGCPIRDGEESLSRSSISAWLHLGDWRCQNPGEEHDIPAGCCESCSGPTHGFWAARFWGSQGPTWQDDHPTTWWPLQQTACAEWESR